MIKTIELLNPEIKHFIDRLCDQEVSIEVASSIESLAYAVSDAVKLYDSNRIELLKKYGKKSEDGLTLEVVDGNVQFENDEQQAAFAKEIEIIANIVFKKTPISRDAFKSLKLKANELLLFRSLFEII